MFELDSKRGKKILNFDYNLKNQFLPQIWILTSKLDSILEVQFYPQSSILTSKFNSNLNVQS